MRWIIIGLAVTTMGLGASTGYLAYEHTQDRSLIASLVAVNEQMDNDLQGLVDSYNADLEEGLVKFDVTNAELAEQLKSVARRYSTTSAKLADATARASMAKAQLQGKQETVESAHTTIERLVAELNAANVTIAKLQSGKSSGTDVDQLVKDFNAAYAKISELEAKPSGLSQADTQKLIDELNAANRRIAELQAQLGSRLRA